MSISYLVSPSQETKWMLDIETFTESLRTDWPQAEITYPVERATCLLEWSDTTGKYGVLGFLLPGSQAISLEGDLTDCAKYVVWFRKLVPIQQELIFYDSGFEGHISLNMEVTKQDVINYLGDDFYDSF